MEAMRVEGKSFLVLSWSMYDLANQFFALNIVSLYFPRWLTINKNCPELFYSLAFGLSMLFVALCAPFLGALSDARRRRKAYLVYFTVLSVVFTMALGAVSTVYLALIFFAIANFGCQEAIIFYNALMLKVAPRGKIGLVSGIGRMFGYSGAILALVLTKPVILRLGYHATFFFTGVLFLVFALPCMIFIKEGPSKMRRPTRMESLGKMFARMRQLVFEKDKTGDLRNFLAAAFFGLCAVNTVILFMAVYAGKVFGLDEGAIIDLVAFSTVFAIAGSVISGFVSDFIGYRRSLMYVFSLWCVCILGAGLLRPPFHWLIGAMAGMSIGSTWVVLRAMVIKLVPEERVGEAFGLFNLVSYFSGMVGPVLWGVILLYFARFPEWGYRAAFLGLIPFMLIALVFLSKIRDNSTIKI